MIPDLLTMPEAAAKFRMKKRTFADMIRAMERDHSDTEFYRVAGSRKLFAPHHLDAIYELCPTSSSRRESAETRSGTSGSRSAGDGSNEAQKRRIEDSLDGVQNSWNKPPMRPITSADKHLQLVKQSQDT